MKLILQTVLAAVIGLATPFLMADAAMRFYPGLAELFARSY